MVVPTAVLWSIGHRDYYVPLTSSTVSLKSRSLIYGSHRSDASLTPATLFDVDHIPQLAKKVEAAGLAAVVKSWLQADDVFSEAFLAQVFLVQSDKDLNVELEALFKSWNTITVHCVSLGETPTSPGLLLSGPYFFDGHGLHPAWGIFPDTNAAFTCPTVPCSESPRKYVSIKDTVSFFNITKALITA